MITMDPSLLKKYLAGNASDEEIQLCERFLSDPANEVLQDEFISDSLLDTIRNIDHETASSDVGHLVEKIQNLIPRQSIGEDDLARILSPSPSADELGRIGPYRVLEFIASGGMGVVFKAQDPKLDRLLCIKVLNPAMAIQRDATARFAREAKAAASLRNDRIVTVLDVGEHRDLPYLVMQLLDGQSLRDKLAAEGKLSTAVARKFAYQIAEGLRYAHRLGLLHRDIKPENIWITTEGNVKLLDFGLAVAGDETSNLTATGTILGTPSYMSPEQVQGKPLDQRSDLFSVGSVLFEMLTGQSPFGRANIFSTMMSVANESLVFPSDADAVPAEMEQVLRSLLAKSPEDRIASADELISVLEVDADQNLLAPSKHRASSTSGIGRGWVAFCSGIAGAAFLALAFFIFQLNDKGTLVVEADRSVSVSIDNEKVQIVDPETGKQFTVTVGDHPLPSGVYQLQMTDASGDYQLSSDVVVIRRGEKQIVKVYLKPPAATAIKEGTVANAEPAPTLKPKLTLADLPTLDAEAMRRKLNDRGEVAIAKNATVREPAPKAGIDSWSIESQFESFEYGAMLLPNADGRWLALNPGSESGFVRIWNQDAELVQMIPVHDAVKQIHWSPEPSILAVIENGDRHKRIVIWKIFDDRVEILDVIPAMADRVAWSWDGLKMAIQSETELTFYDLAEQKVFTHPNFGIRGTISNHPLSSDNRFLATLDKESQSVKVWDLQEQKLFHIFAGAEESQFLPEGNRIAIRNHGVWEVWALEKFERENLISPGPDWLTYQPDARFEKLAAINKDGDLVIQDLTTGKRSVRKFEQDPVRYVVDPAAWPRLAGNAKINWSEDCESLVCGVGGHRFVAELTNADADDGVDFRLQRMPSIDHAITAQSSRLPPSASESGDIIAMFGGTYDEAGPVVCYDLAKARLLSKTAFQFFDTGAEFKLSPDGKQVAIRAAATELPQSVKERTAAQQAWSEEMQQIRIFSTESGESVRNIPFKGSLVSFHWTSDSSSIVLGTGVRNDGLAQERSRYYRMQPVIIDVASGKQIPLTFKSDSSDQNAVQWHFQREAIANNRGLELDFPSMIGNQIALPIFAEAGDSSTAGSIGFFNAKSGVIEEVTTLGSRFQISRGNLAISERLIAIGKFPTFQSNRSRASNSNEFLAFDRKNNLAQCRVQRGFNMNSGWRLVSPAHPYLALVNRDEVRVLHANSAAGQLEEIKRISNSSASNREDTVHWHPTEPVFAMISQQQSHLIITWYNAETDTLVVDESVRSPSAILPIKTGWLVVGYDELVEFDLDFKRQKTHLQTQRFTNLDVLGFDQCVSASGEIIRPDNAQNLRLVRRRENRFETVPVE